MRSFKTFAIAAALMGLASASYAELQNVEVGGQIRIRANYYDGDDTFNDLSYVEQRTRLSVKADFTDEVSMFIELDEYGIWGDSLRSNYFTGADGDNAVADEVSLYQAYIQADEMWGTPLRLRVGRQEMSFGSEWLVGTNDTSSGFWGLSFDAIRLDYITDEFSVAAFISHLAEGGGDGFLEDDVFFAGIYGSYTGLEDITIDAYYMLVRDEDQAGTGLVPTAAYALGTYPIGRQWGVADPGFLAWNNPLDRNIEDTSIHTIGLRGAGTYGAFDFEAEIAYQMGDIEVHNPFNFFFWDIGQTSEKEYGELGVNLAAGYTFDASWTPRIGLGFAYFGGADEENQASPFDWQEELSFNRLFSNWEYSEFIENTDLSNAFIFTGSLSANPTEAIALSLYAAYFMSDEEPDYGWFWNLWENTDAHLGWELGLYAEYNYSEDLIFRAGFATFWAGDGYSYGGHDWPFGFLDRLGNAHTGNGLYSSAAPDNDETYHYIYVETELKF